MGRHKSHPPDSGHGVIGSRIRQLRRARGLTLAALGAQVGLSHAFLSQVERGLANPSFLTLHDIASALGISPSVLVAQTSSGLATLVRGSDASSVYGTPGVDDVIARSLSPREALIKVVVSEGPFDVSEQMAHPGEEFVYVLEGEIEVAVESDVYELRSGDALTFDCSRPHAYRTLNGSAPRVLVAVADPGAYADALDDIVYEKRRHEPAREGA